MNVMKWAVTFSKSFNPISTKLAIAHKAKEVAVPRGKVYILPGNYLTSPILLGNLSLDGTYFSYSKSLYVPDYSLPYDVVGIPTTIKCNLDNEPIPILFIMNLIDYNINNKRIIFVNTINYLNDQVCR